MRVTTEKGIFFTRFYTLQLTITNNYLLLKNCFLEKDDEGLS